METTPEVSSSDSKAAAASADGASSGGSNNSSPPNSTAAIRNDLPAPVIPPPVAPPAPAIPAPVVVAPPPPVVPPPSSVASAPPKPPVRQSGGEPPGIMSRFRDGGEDGEGPRMGFLDHLLELRRRLWVCVVTVFVCVLVCMIFYKEIYAVMRMPLDKVNVEYRHDKEALAAFNLPDGSDVAEMINVDPLGTMLMVVWLGVGAGMVISSPIIFYQLWGFIAPGLREKEKRAIRPVLYGGIFFFLIGVWLAYKFLFQVSIEFFVWLDIQLKTRPQYTVENYMGLIINVMAVSGLSCELPLVIGALAKLQVIHPSQLTKYWRVCILTAFILGAVLSPGTDVMSMVVFSALFLGLYGVSVVMAYLLYPKEAKAV